MKILGTGSSIPAQVVTNAQLAEILDTSDAWIRTRTGIETRHILSGEMLADLGEAAARRALESAGIRPEGVDYLLCSTVQGDVRTPSLASQLAGRLGACCPTLDINGACAGFLYALDLAGALIDSGRAGRVLIACCEAMSRMVDWRDRSTAVLFGDGAAAAIVGPGEGLLSIRLTTQPDDRVLHAGTAWGNCPYSPPGASPEPLYMAGQEVFRFAVNSAVRGICGLLQEQELSPDNLDCVLLHQANLRILRTVGQRMSLPEEKLPHIIEKTGNTSSASLPMLLDHVLRAGQLRLGALVAMSAFGAGLTSGACLYRC